MRDLLRISYLFLAIFFLMELFALTAFGYWGFSIGRGWLLKIVLGLGTPLLVAIIWGTFVAPKASIPVSIPLRILLQLVIFGAAAVALNAVGKSTLSIVFMGIVLIEIGLVNILSNKHLGKRGKKDW